MASRSGVRPWGSDGLDFAHREKVANHYKVSALTKWRLKVLTIFHFLMLFLMACRLSTYFLVLAGLRPPSFLQRLRLPKSETWELVWMFSVMPSIMGLVAIRRNKVFLMRHYCFGLFTFGILPLFYAIYDISDDLLNYWDTRKTEALLLGFPVVVLWAMFVTIAIQIHFFGMYFGYQLIKAWRARGALQQQKKVK